MRKLIALLSLILIMKVSIGQVIVNLQLPQVGVNLKSQLWNLALTNTGTSTITIKINLLLTDLSNGQQVLAGTTNLLQLAPGTKMLQYNDVVPVNYTVLNSSYNVDVSPNGFLPVGNFNVCFEVLKQVSEAFETLAEDCTAIEVEPANPPVLNTPDDLAETDSKRPLFTWLPPGPFNLFSNLTYEIKLVELAAGQTGTDAIDQNLPVLTQQNIIGTTLQYPSSAAELDTGKTYAWQVTANNNGIFVAKTEVWTFKVIIVGDAVKELIKNTAYFKLQRENPSGYFTCPGMLKFQYNNDANDGTVPIKIYDITNKARKSMNLESATVQMRSGQNLIDIDLLSNGGFKVGHKYIVTLLNSKNETWTGQFVYSLTN